MGAASRNLNKKLQRISKKLPQIAREVEQEEAEELAADIRLDAPVDTGFLRSTVDSSGNKTKVGADYASYVEDDQPYVEPNVQGVKQRLEKRMEQAIKKELS